MASILKVDKLDPQSGTALEIGTSGDTVTVPTGAGLTVTDEVKTNKISPATGTAFALGDSGDTFTIPSGATITNSGTATGFGGGKILQVSNNAISDITQFTLGTGSWEQITTLTVSITPAATSSTIWVIASSHYDTGGASTDFGLNIYRDIAGAGYGAINSYISTQPFLEKDEQRVGFWTYQIVDSPATTSACNYKLYGITGGASYVDMKTANITLLEIDGS
jgi:hypothetical protein